MIDISTLSETELLRLHAQTLARLKELGAVRSTNNPVADLAERLAAKLLGGELAPKSHSSIDVIVARDGATTTYQVKARRVTPHNRSRQLGALRGMDQKRFDYLIGMLFDEHYAPVKGAIIPWEVVKAHSTYIPHTNAWRFLLRDSVWELPGVRNLTLT